jgi:hypothetical protein
MKNPARVTVAFDEETLKLFEEMKEEMKLSQSELVRRALRFYRKNKHLFDLGNGRIETYVDMLSSGEHVILDVDHWLLFLKLIESSPEKEKFWKNCKVVAKSHAEQLSPKIHTIEDLLERLAACNFFRLVKNSESEFTLVLNSDVAKKFVKKLLEDLFESMNFKTEIQEDLGKLRVKKAESQI